MGRKTRGGWLVGKAGGVREEQKKREGGRENGEPEGTRWQEFRVNTCEQNVSCEFFPVVLDRNDTLKLKAIFAKIVSFFK